MKRIFAAMLILGLAAPLSAFEIPGALKKIKNVIPKPTAELKKVSIKSISLRDIDLLFHVEIYNPYPVSLKLREVGYTFMVEGKQFLKTKTEKPLSIKAKKKAMNVFSVNLKYADIMNIVKDYKNREVLNCQSRVRLELWLPESVHKALGKSIAFNFKHDTTLPAVKPKINVVNFKVNMPSYSDILRQLKEKKKSVDAKSVAKMFSNILSGKSAKNIIDPTSIDVPIDVNFDIHLKNEARAKLLFNNLNYNFYVGSNKLVGGLTKKIVQKGDVSVISIGNRFSSKSLSKSIYELFKKGKGDFSVQGVTKLQLPVKYFKEPLDLKFTEGGNFSIR